jgi:hypothetical protein
MCARWDAVICAVGPVFDSIRPSTITMRKVARGAKLDAVVGRCVLRWRAPSAQNSCRSFGPLLWMVRQSRPRALAK